MGLFLKESNVKQRDEKTEIDYALKFIKLSDKKIISEDEKKFQEYFLKEKNKTERVVCSRRPVCKYFELSLNKEFIEQKQEMIIEQEEWVPEYPVSKDKYLGPCKSKISKLEETVRRKRDIWLTSLHRLKSKLEGWFISGEITFGLKGGADHNKPGSNTFQFLI